MIESSHVFEDVGRQEFQAQMVDAILFTVPPQLLWLSGLIPSHFPDTSPALTAVSLYHLSPLT